MAPASSREAPSSSHWLTTVCAIAILHLSLCLGKTSNTNSKLLRFNGKPTTLRNDDVWSIGCLQESWYSQRLDHFHRQRGGDDPTFPQRYFICDKFWSQNPSGSRGPVFFYAGNEADVTLYVNATGLIWEHAEEFGALVLFVEHRYYGKSQPFGPDSWSSDPSYLSVEQAMADYATLLWHVLPQMGAEDSPIIAFGGSYGGMLAAWLRLKYPHLIAGAVAASAPVGAFPGVPGWEPSRFWQVVTYDATASAGAAAECSSNVRAAFRHVLTLGRTVEGRKALGRLLRLCEAVQDEAAVLDVAYWLQGAFDAFAMGNYPYPSSYISGDPEYPLPAWPMRAACNHLASNRLEPSDLVEALRDAGGVLYNVTGQVQCYNVQATGPAAGSIGKGVSEPCDPSSQGSRCKVPVNSHHVGLWAAGHGLPGPEWGPWDYQWCTELMGQELPYYPTNGVSDMFWDQGAFDLNAINAHCQDAWGVTPWADWSALTYGGLDYQYASNIVFSNGLYDPWSVYGVLHNVSNSVVAIIIPEGAHHLDLMYANPADPPSVRAARQVEMRHVRRWIDQFYEMRQKRPNSTVPGQGRDTSAGADASMAESATASVA
ncbi:hypothetical protein VaNZ11_003469 [Volvox africanus]|uniref:Lysosomal Pro-X carboxypeptidase n=1 Tax=Volvox africanus TaxID=51714 RepID=A0ABQ5RV39_9CHLO|nr:hypothetical protein VaNZ11_003469 [Volvox africanus]